MADYANAIDKIVQLNNPPVVKADGEDYIKDGYNRAVKPTDKLIKLQNEHEIEGAKLAFNAVKTFDKLTTLSSLCEMLKAEVNRGVAAFPYFVNVADYNAVAVYGSYEVNNSRKTLYVTVADNEDFDFKSQPLEQAIITLQSRYVNGGCDYAYQYI